MDLTAYTQIDDLEQIAKANNINVPRLRGYSLMKDEQPLSKEDIAKMVKDEEPYICKRLCCNVPFWSPNSYESEFSSRTDRLIKRYLIKGKDEDGFSVYKGIRWDRIHGKRKKVLKLEIKKKKDQIQKQYDVWNKYAGKENVLRIHSRIGGGNWDYYGGNELSKQPWFLEKVDDCYDDTYCDIYAKINL